MYPGDTWERTSPSEAGLQEAGLDYLRQYLGGRGCVVRRGRMVYTWGDYRKRGDVASAAKPWYAHFLFKAVEEGRIPDLDEPVSRWEPRLNEINESLGGKDRAITWRHLANQTSCYGVREAPGLAYDYNDWQMALFWDALFLRVYGASYESVDAEVVRPKLTEALGCEDDPTLMAFGVNDRAGRVGVSPRDFARFGLLYLHKGNWRGTQLLDERHATMAVTSPLPLSIPRTAGQAAEMIPDQRSMGSTDIPDDQTDHHGSYSWLWWVNGERRDGRRFWPDAPTDTFAALGHANGKRGMAVVPGLDLVLSWNDTLLDEKPSDPHPLNAVFKALMEAARD